MDREGFRNRLKQYKKAREENPGLKYWEWKDIPKYDEGTDGVTLKEKEDAFWRGDTQKMAELVEREGKQVTYVDSNNTLDEIVVTAKDLKKEQQRKQEYNDVLDLGITAAGFVPGLGEVADVMDVINQLRQGNYGDASLAGLGLTLPFVPGAALRRLKNNVWEWIGDKTGYYRHIPTKQNEMYRQVTQSAIDDAERVGIVRANPNSISHGKPVHYTGAAFKNGELYLPKNKDLNYVIVGNSDEIEFVPRWGHMKYDDFDIHASRTKQRGYDVQEYTPVFNGAIDNSPISQFYYYKRGDKGLSKYFWKKKNFDLSKIDTRQTTDDVFEELYKAMDTDVLDAHYLHSAIIGDLKNSQRFRDLHFVTTAPGVVKNSENLPLMTYHTVGDKYNPSFTVFNSNIEGTHSAIYTTDDPIMSGSYSKKNVSQYEADVRIQDKIKELNNYFSRLISKSKNKEQLIESYTDYLKYMGTDQIAKQNIINDYPQLAEVYPERMKKLYVNLKNPLVMDAAGDSWGHISTAKLPENVWNNINNPPSFISTRDIENIYKHFGYDGAIIKNVVDYGGNKITSKSLIPNTVFEINDPVNLKLSDAVTYDDDGKIIKLSKRDDFKNPDIRFAEGGEVTGPPTYEQWYNDATKYNPTILDNASMYWSIEAAKKALHNEAMGLPGYAPMWNNYVRSLPKADPDINQFVDDLWTNENPNNVGLKNGKYYPHKSPEGGKMTIGPGFKLGSGSHSISTKTANRGMTKTRLDQEARKIGKQHLAAVDQFLNYGQTTNPADTVSPQIKMGLMDLRHQVGPLNEWGNLRQAVLEGDLDRIKKESTVTWNDNGKIKVDKRRKKIRDEKYFYYE